MAVNENKNATLRHIGLRNLIIFVLLGDNCAIGCKYSHFLLKPVQEVYEEILVGDTFAHHIYMYVCWSCPSG
jgi:hypothetical protein